MAKRMRDAKARDDRYCKNGDRVKARLAYNQWYSIYLCFLDVRYPGVEMGAEMLIQSILKNE